MRIDVVYDFLCPWCHVGKRQLDKALAAEAARKDSVPIEIHWRQFMLYPDLDRGGHDFREFFNEQYGPALQVPMWDQIRDVAAPIGINFAFEKITRGPASIDGHRLVRWAAAQRPGVAGVMIEEIARSFFEEALVIDEPFLVRLSEKHGFDGAAARSHLRSDDDIEALFRETDGWRAAGVESVPHYIIRLENGVEQIIRNVDSDSFSAAFDDERTLFRQW